jgi:hypothetical protein
MPDETPPVPTNFGWRYVLWASWWNFWHGLRIVLWFAWRNAITILMLVQAAFGSVLLIADAPLNSVCSIPGHVPVGHECDPMIPHTVSRLIIVANAILCAVIAQFKRSNPPPDKPPQR